MGRKKIEIKKIENLRARQVCFSKRRNGLFKKAAELSRLCNVDIAAVAFSPAGNPFVFGDPRLFLDLHVPSASASETESPPLVKKDCMEFDDISGLSLSQLEEYSLSLETLRADVMKKLKKEAVNQGRS